MCSTVVPCHCRNTLITQDICMVFTQCLSLSTRLYLAAHLSKCIRAMRRVGRARMDSKSSWR